MLIDGRKSETSNTQASGEKEKIKDAQLSLYSRKPRKTLNVIIVDLQTHT